jgi:hypothetical protein
MRPNRIDLAKERLYEENLGLKMELNQLKSDNSQLKTQISTL